MRRLHNNTIERSNLLQATAVFGFLFVVGKVPASLEDNRWVQ